MAVHRNIEFIPSAFGGGWALPLTGEARDDLFAFYDDEPCPIEPLDGRLGYIVEPHEASDLAHHLGLPGAC